MYQPLAETIIKELVRTRNTDRKFLDTLKRRLSKEQHVSLVTNTNLIKSYRTLVLTKEISENKELEKFLRRRQIRSQSGVAIITLLTMPYPCPGKCIYCPTEARMPKSYIETEPAAQRALVLQFDPYIQTLHRINTLEDNGHPVDKIEIILKGGTWSAYPVDYQQWFITEIYRAMNDAGVRLREIENSNPTNQYNRFWGSERKEWNEEKLFEAQKENETAPHRCIGLTIETRPDWISIQEIKRLRSMGCTRVELGVQTTDDAILTLIKRGHDRMSVVHATKLLKDAGFKVDYHLMPGLPGATCEKDIQTAHEVFECADFQPDTVKLYPCLVIPTAELQAWYDDGRYIPYSTEQLISLLSHIKTVVPPYVRIARVIRDVPSPEISAGNKVTNLRETIQRYMKNNAMVCRCLRCREVGHNQLTITKEQLTPTMKERIYTASEGKEYFLSFESEDEKIVFSFLRLRLPLESPIWEHIPELKDAALIRELHTYGTLIALHKQGSSDDSQHKGLGKKLLEKAEHIAQKNGFKKIAIISGIGVREYYKKYGYVLEGTYMVKQLTIKN